MKINKYLPFAILYFFFNSVGLPFGLTWMALLAPFFYVWILLTRKKEILLPFLAVMLPFIILHIALVGVELKVYLVSLALMVMVYIFCQAFYTFLIKCPDPERIFRFLLIGNFICCLLGIIFYFTPWVDLFWIKQQLTQGVNDFRRFRLFSYEASYYGTLFIPLFFFYFLQWLFRQNKIKGYWLIPMIFLPLILSFSIGVIAAAFIACLLVLFIYFRRLAVKKRVFNLIVNIGFLFAAALTILVIYFRHNPLFTRVLNIFSGTDTSAKGRTADSFILAKKMLDEKNEWWGIGVGQIKLLGHDLVQRYYLYNMDFIATIPNAMAETLAIFGWIGFSLKLLIEIALFFITMVWTNYYRLLLFFFVFIYQFTGSFITNMAEYVIWILAFTNVFKQFDVFSLTPRKDQLPASSHSSS